MYRLNKLIYLGFHTGDLWKDEFEKTLVFFILKRVLMKWKLYLQLLWAEICDVCGPLCLQSAKSKPPHGSDSFAAC